MERRDVIKMKVMIALLMAITVIYFISTFLKYLHWRNTPPKQFWPVNVCRNSLIGTVVPPIPLCNGHNLQYIYPYFSAISFLVRLH